MNNLSMAKWRKDFESDLISSMNEETIGEYSDLLYRPASKQKEQLVRLKQQKKMELRLQRYNQPY